MIVDVIVVDRHDASRRVPHLRSIPSYRVKQQVVAAHLLKRDVELVLQQLQLSGQFRLSDELLPGIALQNLLPNMS